MSAGKGDKENSELKLKLDEAHKRNKKAFLDGFAYGENNAYEIVYNDPKLSSEECLKEWDQLKYEGVC